ncbi:MAG: class II SORL domain-containing protein [Kiritimatiellia bacterium]
MLSEYVKTADWKNEKHVPVIDCDDNIAADTCTQITISVGKEIPHPNTSGHHIVWVALHYVPEGSQVSVEIARTEFSAHAASADGKDSGQAKTCSSVTVSASLKKSGTLYATAYCNIHGLWASEKTVTVA